MFDPMKYTINVRKGEFDGEVCFQARVLELPDLVEYGDSAEEVYALAIDSIETTAEVFLEEGKQMPAPIIPVDDYSGRVTLRLPKPLHRSLAIRAEMDDVSLNQYLVSVLSSHNGYLNGLASAADGSNWRAGAVKSASNKPAHLTVVATRRLQNCA